MNQNTTTPAKPAPEMTSSPELLETSCLCCPACGTELCDVMQELGTHCDLRMAAAIAEAEVRRHDARSN